ncbi:MAG: GNAT family N-acetyltransferase [Candidatus Omnitrophota bacterium]
MFTGGITIRPVKEDDCQNLLIWRNHPDVRHWCFEDREISLTEHKEWFKKAIKDKDTYMYIAEDEKNMPLGQVRFKVTGVCAEININLNPDFFGKGLGHIIIRKVTEFFLAQRPDMGEIFADIIEDNVASLKAFQKVGYAVWSTGLRKSGKNFIRLVYYAHP